MDGGGRVPGSLTGTAVSQPPASAPATAVLRRRRPARRSGGGAGRLDGAGWWRGLTRRLDRILAGIARLMGMCLPRHAGVAAALLIVVASAGYGTVRGGHVGEILDRLKD